MTIQLIELDFSDDQVFSERNYKEELDKVINDLKLEIQSLGSTSKQQKNFAYAEFLVANAIKMSNEIINDMKKELIKNNIRPD